LHFTKEKEMADFRKWIIALAVVLLCAGLASAQQGGGGSTTFTCSVNTASTPTLRSEGITEQIGDIVIICSGGATVTPGALAPSVNITVSLTSQVTSRLLNSASVSEALLLIDDPNTSPPGAILLPGFGGNAGFIPCPNPSATQNGCAGPGAPAANRTVEASIVGPGGLPFQVGVQPPAGPAPGTAAWNTYQGVVTGNQVTFYGVPVVPPGTTANRTLRITNVRVNASGIGGGSASGALPVQASILTSNPSALPISNPTPIVAFVQQSLSTSVAGPSTLAQCTSACLSQASVLTFKELFASAFKTRVDPTVPNPSLPAGGMAGQAASFLQNVPGSIYSGESGFTLANGSVAVGGPDGGIGLADNGTRFTAVFNNIPAGARVFVSQFGVTLTNGVVTGDVETGPSWAQAITSDTIADGNGSIPAATAATITCNGATIKIPVVEITPTSGNTATASWESITNSPSAIDTYNFGVFITYTASPGTNSPAAGTGTVNLRYGPASTVTTASSSAPEPRFLDTSTSKNAIAIGICRTVLLFPFVTNQAGFDTGIAISNTSTDPFGTTPQNGTCTENWFGAAAPATPTTTPIVATGTSSTTLASITVPGFQGYMIAVCNFQYAHGFAFISDVGARNLAMGYLALVIPDPNLNGGRLANDQSQSALSSGEQLSQ
jgi:large repetitive protein